MKSRTGSWTETADHIIVITPYCEKNNEEFRRLGGVYNNGWHLALSRRQLVIEALGDPSTGMVEAIVNREACNNGGAPQITIGWHVIASRRTRDSRVDHYAELVEGTCPSSGGSVKNPRVAASDDCKWKLDCPRDFAERYGLQIVTETAPTERELMARNAIEIYELLKRIVNAPNDEKCDAGIGEAAELLEKIREEIGK